MHEWALAEAVVLTVKDYAEKNKLEKIREVVVVLGELQQIDDEVFLFALRETAGLHGISFEAKIKKQETELKCLSCGKKWKPRKLKQEIGFEAAELVHFVPEAAHAYLKCPKCRSPDFRIVKGRGVSIESIK